MGTPNASYSVCLTVELDHRPGVLGRVATAIGEAGGNIVGIDIADVTGDVIVRDITVFATDDAHVERIRAAAEAIDGCHVASALDRTFLMHEGGKIEVVSRSPVDNRDDLSMAYTPGVARVCMAIAEEPAAVHEFTIKRNTVAVVTDGTAVLGLGDIGPEASLPVMEGKALLFKEFAGVDAFPICLRTSSADELVEAVERIAPVFGGINLEDISAPNCFEVEDRLKESLDIPVFHDDQHGTAVVALAALRNALKVVDKKMEDLSVVMAGAGAAGVAVTKILLDAGVRDIVAADRQGALHVGRSGLTSIKQWMAENTNPEGRKGSLGEVMGGSDVFIGVSGPGLISTDDLRSMARDPIVFAMANPDPEIKPEDAGDLVAVMATGRSDYPNQINNVLAFPGIFRGALDAGAVAITEGMKLAAAEAIASTVGDAELSPAYIVPSVFNRRVDELVCAAVAQTARAEGVVRKG
jgi:malate dehydrogenase (oxaloacetate-decarboxylating)